MEVVNNHSSNETSAHTTLPDLCMLSDIDSDSSVTSLGSDATQSNPTQDRYESLDSCIDACTVAQLVQGHQSKRRKTEIDPQRDLRPVAFVRLNTRRGKAKPTTIKALLDSGASETLVCKKYTKNLKVSKVQKGNQTQWSTPGGSLTTNEMVKCQFTMPELHDDKLIE